jgi:hypothetical protein
MTAQERSVFNSYHKEIKNHLTTVGKANRLRFQGLKGFGALSYGSSMLNAYQMEKLSKETGIDVWTLMTWQLLGLDINQMIASCKL